ncbi:hypothetical protein RCC89_14655 [Cytophagaceae bacterium ABcell3]|nr:hypothetical protein RCC89_14655 [Cytophagaceae bacterium ABcell3]
MKPSTALGQRILDIHKLESKTDNELIDIAFSSFSFCKYRMQVISHFRKNHGSPLSLRMLEWISFLSNKNRLFSAIQEKIARHHNAFHHIKPYTLDISSEIRLNWPSFRTSFPNLSEMIAVGGIQEVEIFSKNISQQLGFDYWNKFGRIQNSPHKVKVPLTVLLKDWFGVDEEDYTNTRLPALLDKEGLAALWVLQHQRGYKPFINILRYETILDINIGYCR